MSETGNDINQRIRLSSDGRFTVKSRGQAMTNQPDAAALAECPNPWCESEDPVSEYQGASGLWHCGCEECGINGPWAKSRAEAIATWNTRAKPAGEVVEHAEQPRQTGDVLDKCMVCGARRGVTLEPEQIAENAICSTTGKADAGLADDLTRLANRLCNTVPRDDWRLLVRCAAAIRLAALSEDRIATEIRTRMGEQRACPHGSTGPCSVCGDEG